MNTYEQDEIDLIQIVQKLWRRRKTLIKYIIIFATIGLFVALFSAKEYQASTIVVPQVTSSKVGGSLGGLAAMAGIDLGGGSSESIPPELYPKVMQSIPFQRELLKVPLRFSDIDHEVTYQTYYDEYQKFNLLSFVKTYTLGLPGKIIGLFKNKDETTATTQIHNDSIYRVSVEEDKFFRRLQSQLSIDVNDKGGFIEISFSMPEALPAAQMTKKVTELLQDAITRFKSQKAEDKYRFIEQRYQEVKKDFLKKQATLASFRDRNKGLILSRSQSRLERLQSEYNLSYGLYSELAKQLEMQKIKLKEDTPVFTVIKPVSVPVQRSKPKRFLILVIWSFFGVVLGSFVILTKEWLANIRMKMND